MYVHACMYVCVAVCDKGVKRNPAWIETFNVQFLGSVEVPHHQGNGILCAAMQKVCR